MHRFPGAGMRAASAVDVQDIPHSRCATDKYSIQVWCVLLVLGWSICVVLRREQRLARAVFLAAHGVTRYVAAHGYGASCEQFLECCCGADASPARIACRRSAQLHWQHHGMSDGGLWAASFPQSVHASWWGTREKRCRHSRVRSCGQESRQDSHTSGST